MQASRGAGRAGGHSSRSQPCAGLMRLRGFLGALVLLSPSGALARQEQPAAGVFATLIDEEGLYLPGVQALAASLLESNNTEPLVLITTARREDWDLDLLRTAACMNMTLVQGERLGEEGSSAKYYSKGIDKLFIFALPASRVVYLDADMIVLGSLRRLFHPKAPRLRAVADGMVEDGFNSGLLAINPDREVYDKMKQEIDVIGTTFGDQGFLNSFFSQYWARTPKARLPQEFNVVRLLERGLGGSTEREFGRSWIRVLHFVGEKKPWTPTSYNKAYPISQGLFEEAAAAYARRCGAFEGPADAAGFCEGIAAVPSGYAPRACARSSAPAAPEGPPGRGAEEL